MKVGIYRLKGIEDRLDALTVQLKRIADALEEPQIEEQPPLMPRDDPRDAEVTYSDHERDFLKEMAKAAGVKIPGIYDPNEDVKE